ncbi:MAG: SIR2 family protein [Acidobacteria bacterium]|nr:SIR2 family protein [Acidobacteriota bacterium]
MDTKKYRIIILGAGFSQAAGLPLASELWAEIRKRARSLTGRARKFQEDLEAYLEFRRRCDGVCLTEDQVDFEDFMRVLDIEHFLALRGSDTWSDDGNEATIVVKWLLGQVLAERTPSPEHVPELYLDFARQLQPDDHVLTFNYDVLLERALDVVGKPYRLFPYRYSELLEDGGGIADTSGEEVVVLKLHGSIDWFDRRQFAGMQNAWRCRGITLDPTHRIFNHMGELSVTKLDDGPRHPQDLMAHMYRVGNIRRLYEQGIGLMCAPWLLAPSTIKIVYAERLRDFWYGLARGGFLNYGMAIIGYSLPPQDEYARQAIYTLATNYQASYGWEADADGRRKSPLVIVDQRPDEGGRQQCRERYRFVDWGRARLLTEGFNNEAINAIFDSV